VTCVQQPLQYIQHEDEEFQLKARMSIEVEEAIRV
jgi:hypothetical protein